jgi:hypothetical protein
MATAVASYPVAGLRCKVGAIHLLATGGVTAVVAFVLCWLGSFLPSPAQRTPISPPVNTAPVNSLAALAESGLWSLLFGGLVGAAYAFFYNATAGWSADGRAASTEH